MVKAEFGVHNLNRMSQQLSKNVQLLPRRKSISSASLIIDDTLRSWLLLTDCNCVSLTDDGAFLRSQYKV